MTVPQFLNIIGVILGFIAALFFCIGSAAIRKKEIKDVSGSYWNENPYLARFFISVKSDYLCGGIALSISFISQLVANIPCLFPNRQIFTTPFGGTITALATSLLTALCLYLCRNKIRSSLRNQM